MTTLQYNRWEIPAGKCLEVYLNIQNQVASQDIAIVNSQQPRRLPLNLQAEVHLPSDRYSIAYGQWLKQQGITFGTI